MFERQTGLEWYIPLFPGVNTTVIGKEPGKETVGFYRNIMGTNLFQSDLVIMDLRMLVCASFSWLTCSLTGLTQTWVQNIPIPDWSWEHEYFRRCQIQAITNLSEPRTFTPVQLLGDEAGFIKLGPIARRFQKRFYGDLKDAEVDSSLLLNLCENKQEGSLRLGGVELRLLHTELTPEFVFCDATLPWNIADLEVFRADQVRYFECTPEKMGEFCARVLRDRLVKKEFPDFHFPDTPIRGDGCWEVEQRLGIDNDPFFPRLIDYITSPDGKEKRIRTPIDKLVADYLRETSRNPDLAVLAAFVRMRELLGELREERDTVNLADLPRIAEWLDSAIGRLQAAIMSDSSELESMAENLTAAESELRSLQENLHEQAAHDEAEARADIEFVSAKAKQESRAAELRAQHEALESRLAEARAEAERLRNEIAAAGDDPKLNAEEAALRVGWERLREVGARLGLKS